MTIAEANYPFDVGIKQLCAQKGMKQKYLAEQIGCSEQALCDIMAGRRLIKACEIPRFAKVLGVTIDQIEAAGLYMTMDEIRQAWSMSRANPFGENSTHLRFPAEMAKKTVTRKACKPLINAADDSTLVLESICRTSDEATDSRLDAEIERSSSAHDVDIGEPYDEGTQIIDVDPNTGEVVGNGNSDGQASGTDPY